MRIFRILLLLFISFQAHWPYIDLHPSAAALFTPSYCRPNLLRNASEWVEQLHRRMDEFELQHGNGSLLTKSPGFKLDFYAVPPYSLQEVKDIVSYIMRKPMWEDQLKLRGFSCRWFDHLAAIVDHRPVRIDVLGGSSTAGNECRRTKETNAHHITGLYDWRPCAWPRRLEVILNSNLRGEGRPLIKVLNRAMPGTDIAANNHQLYYQMKEPAAVKPDILIIASQTNDQFLPSTSRNLNWTTERLVRGALMSEVLCIDPPPLIIFFEDCYGFRCRIFFQRNVALHSIKSHAAVADYYGLPTVDWSAFVHSNLPRRPGIKQRFMDEPRKYNMHPGAPTHLAMALFLLKALFVTHGACCAMSSSGDADEKADAERSGVVNGTLRSGMLEEERAWSEDLYKIPASAAFLELDKSHGQRGVDDLPEFHHPGHCAYPCPYYWFADHWRSTGLDHIIMLTSSHWSYEYDHVKFGFHASADSAYLELVLKGSYHKNINGSTVMLSISYMMSYGDEWGVAAVRVEPVGDAKAQRRSGVEGMVRSLMLDSRDSSGTNVSVTVMRSVEVPWHTRDYWNLSSADSRHRFYLLQLRMVRGSKFKLQGISLC